MIAIQEGVKFSQGGVTLEKGFHIISGRTENLGAAHLILAPRIGRRIRRTTIHSHYVIAEVGMTPPLIMFSLYLPPFGTHGAFLFEEVLAQFQIDLQTMHQASPGSFILGGTDGNTELRETGGLIGRYNGTGERPQDLERTDSFQGFLSAVGVKASSSYYDFGPTRYPWPGQSDKQAPSVIDYIVASPKLITKPLTKDLPIIDVATDHRPIGMEAQAPYKSRKDRRRQFEHLLAHPPG